MTMEATRHCLGTTCRNPFRSNTRLCNDGQTHRYRLEFRPTGVTLFCDGVDLGCGTWEDNECSFDASTFSWDESTKIVLGAHKSGSYYYCRAEGTFGNLIISDRDSRNGAARHSFSPSLPERPRQLSMCTPHPSVHHPCPSGRCKDQVLFTHPSTIRLTTHNLCAAKALRSKNIEIVVGCGVQRGQLHASGAGLPQCSVLLLFSPVHPPAPDAMSSS